jgi:hypothetical protein
MLRTLLRTSTLVVFSATLAGAFGCKATDEPEPRSAVALVAETPRDALIETFENGTVAWSIGGDGRVTAIVRDRDGLPIAEGTKGAISWTEGDQIRRADLTWNAESGAFVAAGPLPTAELTEIRYELHAAGTPVAGALHVPAGGTEAFLATANVEARAQIELPKAPHGGVVQVVGEDLIEIVADDATGELRVYVLDLDGQVVAPGDRAIMIAVGGNAPEIVVLAPSSDALFFVGRLRIAVEPPRLTVVVRRAASARVAIVGWRPGVKLVAAGGPRIKIRVKGTGWGAPNVAGHVAGNGKAKAKIDVKAKGPAFVKVDVKEKGGSAKASAGAKVKIKLK